MIVLLEIELPADPLVGICLWLGGNLRDAGIFLKILFKNLDITKVHLGRYDLLERGLPAKNGNSICLIHLGA